jgi:predicted RNase H-like HicB family nuclease
MNNYSLLLKWSEEDACYLAFCSEFEKHLMQPFAHGDNWKDAAKEAAIALEGVIETIGPENELPEPDLYEEKSCPKKK